MSERGQGAERIKVGRGRLADGRRTYSVAYKDRAWEAAVTQSPPGGGLWFWGVDDEPRRGPAGSERRALQSAVDDIRKENGLETVGVEYDVDLDLE